MRKLLITFCYQREEIPDNTIYISSPCSETITAWATIDISEQYNNANELWNFITNSIEKSLPQSSCFKCNKLSVLSISDITNLIKGNENA